MRDELSLTLKKALWMLMEFSLLVGEAKKKIATNGEASSAEPGSGWPNWVLERLAWFGNF
ncbi:hypothetical protein LguiB_013210 [Lonicera macranthoides]